MLIRAGACLDKSATELVCQLLAVGPGDLPLLVHVGFVAYNDEGDGVGALRK